MASEFRLYSAGNDLTERFRLIVEALARLRSRSCVIDGEAVACGEDGIASFDRYSPPRHERVPYALDLIELDGDALRRNPLAVRNVHARQPAVTRSARTTLQRTW
jgi:ATP-dependent DNA ligase